MLIRWRRADIEFDKAVSTARRAEAETRFLKDRLIEHLEAGERPTHAAANIGVAYTTVQSWCRADPAFKTEFDEAVSALTHMELDRLADLHQEILDPKVAMVAGKHITSWIEKRNSKEFGPRSTRRGTPAAAAEHFAGSGAAAH
jgi:hypothetical protein